MQSGSTRRESSPGGTVGTGGAERTGAAPSRGGEGYDLDVAIEFSHAELVLGPTLAVCPHATFRLDFRGWSDTDADTDTDAERLSVSAVGIEAEELCAAMLDDPTVRGVTLVGAFDDEAAVRVEPVPDAVRVLPLIGAVEGYVYDVRGRRNGWTVEAYLPDREALEELNERCRAADVGVHVTRLTSLPGSGTATGPALTRDQRELLVAAVERGYFESPRGVSQRDLAEEFDVSCSAISQRLRTATGKVLADALVAG